MNIFDGAKEHFKNIKRDIKSTAKIILKSSTKWGKISSVPSVDVDVVLTFPSSADMNFIQWLMLQIVENVPELSFSLNYHRNADEYALYITASYKNLLRGAELLNIRKKISIEFGGGYREFNLEELDMFQDVSEEELFLSTQERQSIILYWLNSLKPKVRVSNFGLELYPNQAIIPLLLSKGKIAQLFPLHNYESLKHLEDTWVTRFTNPQPLDDIAGYFGIKIALYFAWLGHYTSALFIPTIVGIIGWQISSQSTMDFYYIFSALFNIIWATFYLKHWRRTCSELTYKWGSLDYQMYKQCEERPEFKGIAKKCVLTGELIKYYPNWKRQLIVYFISIPSIFLSFIAIYLVSVAFNEFQEYVDRKIQEESLISIMSPVPKVILAFVIGFMDDIFKKIATRLTEFENHKLKETHKNYLMTKKILFQFMNSFFSLFYIAFYLQDLVKLREQLATLLITRQFIGNVKEIVMPYVNTRVRQTIMGIRYEKRRKLAEAAAKSSDINRRDSHQHCGELNHNSSESDQEEHHKSRSDHKRRPDHLELTKLRKISQDQSLRHSETPEDVENESEEYIKRRHKHEDKIRTNSSDSNIDYSNKGPKSHGEQPSTSCDNKTVEEQEETIEEDDETVNSSNTRISMKHKSNENQNSRRSTPKDCSSKRSSFACALTPGETTLYQAEEEATLPKYDDPFEDFLEMFIQFGYVSMFACAFPLAGLFCLLNNILEIRSDAFKLISSFQRPFGEQVSSIGVWQRALEVLSYFAVAVNMGLLAVSGGLTRILDSYSDVSVIVSIILIEHFIIVVKFLIDQAMHNVPFWIEQERCLIEHKRREALKAIEKQTMRENRRKRARSCDPLDDKGSNINNNNVSESEDILLQDLGDGIITRSRAALDKQTLVNKMMKSSR